MEKEKYGIEIAHAHERAKALIPEEFFWSCIDELGPFGSDEGDVAFLSLEGGERRTRQSQHWTV